MKMNDIILNMNENKNQKRLIFKAIFVGGLVLFSIICFSILNYNYDSLSRYPYTDVKSREIIKKYLAKPEIDYIIEYSIAPNVFISFIQEDGFNIYHAHDYKKLSEIAWDQSPSKIVTIVEKTIGKYEVEELISYLDHYSFDELYDWILNGDRYVESAILVKDAASLLAYVDEVHTISKRVPYKLQKLEIISAISGQDIYLDAAAAIPLMSLFENINQTIPHENGRGGLEIIDGYVSYQNQEKRYQTYPDRFEAPGHCDNQLGLSVDLSVNGILDSSFSVTEQSQWLREHAYQYGFILLDKSQSENHYRFIGIDRATELYFQGIDFKTYQAQNNAF